MGLPHRRESVLPGAARLGRALLLIGAMAPATFHLEPAEPKSPARDSSAGQAPGRISRGRVVDREGRPVAGARVVAFRDSFPPVPFMMMMYSGEPVPPVADVLTASDGSYSLGTPERAWYVVRASAKGHAPTEVDGVLGPPPRLDDLVLSAADASSVSGTVQLAGGKPVPGATVLAYRGVSEDEGSFNLTTFAYSAAEETTTDAGGAFRFERLGSGGCYFLVSAPGCVPFVAPKITLRPGPNALEAFTLSPGNVVRVRVLDPDGKPLPGAKVGMYREGPPEPARSSVSNCVWAAFPEKPCLTDQEGRYLRDTLRAGSYSLRAEHPDYATSERKGCAPSDGERTVQLERGRTLAGTVHDSRTGRPIAQAWLSADAVWGVNRRAQTDRHGQFALRGLRPDPKTKVYVRVEGYVGADETFDLSKGDPAPRHFELTPLYVLSGRVMDVRGAGLPEAYVYCGDTHSGGFTDPDGSFSLAVKPGRNASVRAWSRDHVIFEGDFLILEPGSRRSDITITLKEGGAVEGRVVAPRGEKLAGFQVSAAGKDSGALTRGQDGHFVLSQLAEGKHRLSLRAPGFLEKAVDGVEVKEGETTHVADVELEVGGIVSGKVVDSRGKGVSGIGVAARRPAKRGFTLDAPPLVPPVGLSQARTSQDGSFRLAGLPGLEPVDLEARDYDLSGEARGVALGSTDVVIVVASPGILKGRVLDPDGKPVRAFSVHPQGKVRGEALRNETFQSADGGFEYEIPSGAYEVRVASPDWARTDLTGVQVKDGDVVDLGKIVLEPRGVISGIVVEASTAKPIAGARVEIIRGASRFLKGASGPAGGPQSPVQVTDAKGAFRYSGLKGGNLTLKVSCADRVSRSIKDVDPDVVNSSRRLVISLEKGGQISGTVLDAGGQPRGDMPVYLIGKDPADNQTCKTDKDGKFRFTGVLSGGFTLKAHRFGAAGKGSEQGEKAVELAPGQSIDVTVTLEGP